MKKLLCSFAVVLFVSSCVIPASAQKMMVGGRFGIDMGSVSVDPAPTGVTLSSHTGIAIGAQLDNWFNDMWALSVGLQYDQKGTHEDATFNVGGFSVSASGDLTMNYLEIPILAKVALGTGDIQPFLFAGPSVGILLSATSTSGSNSQSVDSQLNTVNLSLLLGAGVSYKWMSNISLFLDAGYELGLINIQKNTSVNTFDAQGNVSSSTQTAKTNDIRVAIGAMFALP